MRIARPRAPSIGSALRDALIGHAATRQVRRLLAAFPDDATAAKALVSSSGLGVCQRLCDGEVTVLLFVPQDDPSLGASVRRKAPVDPAGSSWQDRRR